MKDVSQMDGQTKAYLRALYKERVKCQGKRMLISIICGEVCFFVCSVIFQSEGIISFIALLLLISFLIFYWYNLHSLILDENSIIKEIYEIEHPSSNDSSS